MQRISAERLRRVRNEVPMDSLIAILRLDCRREGGRIRFRCPDCRERHLAVNRRTNLARCFACARNYNPIDLVMTASSMGFLEAVQRLELLDEKAMPGSNPRNER